MPHLSGKLLETLRELFGHPEPANLEWRDVFALIRHYGDVEQLKNGHIVLSVGNERLNLQAPHTKTLDKNQVVKLRHLLKAAGVTPEHPELETAERPAPPLPGVILTIDHHQAVFWRQEKAGEPLTKLKRLQPHDPQHHRDNLRLRQATDYQGQRAPEDPSYYKRIIKELQDAPAAIVIGNAEGQSSAMHVLKTFIERHQPGLLRRITAFVDTDLHALTEARIRAIAARYWNASAPVKN